MLNNGPTITIEEFESKYSKEIREKFSAIRKLQASGDKPGASMLYRQLPEHESVLFKQYNDDLKVYVSLQKARIAQLDEKIDGIDHRLAVMKEEKKQVLSQYNQDTASNMREFKPTTPTNRPAVTTTTTTTTTPKKRTSCSIM